MVRKRAPSGHGGAGGGLQGGAARAARLPEVLWRYAVRGARAGHVGRGLALTAVCVDVSAAAGVRPDVGALHDGAPPAAMESGGHGAPALRHAVGL